MKTFKNIIVFVLISAFILGLSGCSGSKQTEGQKDQKVESPKKLVIYTGRDPEVYNPVIDKFVEKYPEYKGNVQVLQMGAQEILERIRAEKENPQCDFWWGGTQDALETATREGLLEPYKASFDSAIPLEYKDKNGYWYGEIVLPEVIEYNSDALKPEDLPKDWDDLLDSKWKDKIIIRNVAPSGTMRTIFAAMIYRQMKATGDVEKGFEWLKKLDANTKEYAANPTDMHLKLARQEGLISLWNLQDVLLQKYVKHMPLDFAIPESGVPMLVDGVAIVKNAKNVDGAKKFMEVLFEPDTQLMLSEKVFQIPTRSDLPKEKMPEWLKNLNLKAMDIDWEVLNKNVAAWIQRWEQEVKGKGKK
ncbi:extracellular solute-binding protein [Caldanaerobacter subterraneus]|uniref:extracellular solute-binding protein n=1 Tax=Caldanaerobacter subterraneus TaxID=911092 RepID=UPI003463B4A4